MVLASECFIPVEFDGVKICRVLLTWIYWVNHLDKARIISKLRSVQPVQGLLQSCQAFFFSQCSIASFMAGVDVVLVRKKRLVEDTMTMYASLSQDKETNNAILLSQTNVP